MTLTVELVTRFIIIKEKEPNVKCMWWGKYINLAKLGLEGGTSSLLCKSHVYPWWALRSCHTKLDMMKQYSQFLKIVDESVASRKTQIIKQYF